MKVEDSKALKEYQEKLKRARCTGNLIDPDESLTVRMNRIQRAKRDVKYLVETYLPHYATADCADFQIAHANKVMNDPIYKGYAEWGRGLIGMERCDHSPMVMDQWRDTLYVYRFRHI